MAECIRYIDPKWVKRMAIIVGNGKTASQLKDAIGCDDIINASYYHTSIAVNGTVTVTPVFHVKSEGKVMRSKDYSVYGCAWKTPDNKTEVDFGVRKISNIEDDSWIAGYPLITPILSSTDALDKNIPSYATKRGRTILGVKNDGTIVIYVCGDGTAEALTATGSREKALEIGCEYAILLDGGGSSQCDFSTGGVIRSTRKVYDYLCIWLYTQEEYDAKYNAKEPEYQIFYRVQVGAFSVKANAENYKLTMQELGYNDAFVKQVIEEDGRILYKVQIGSFSVYDNAKNLETELESKGIGAFISKIYIEK